MYKNVRYKSLKNLRRPFMFAYSAFINQKIKDETSYHGFDKCIDAPLNQTKLEQIQYEYVDEYSYRLTKLMLEKLGPVPYLEEMLDFQKVKNFYLENSSNAYFTLLKGKSNCGSVF